MSNKFFIPHVLTRKWAVNDDSETAFLIGAVSFGIVLRIQVERLTCWASERAPQLHITRTGELRQHVGGLLLTHPGAVRRRRARPKGG